MMILILWQFPSRRRQMTCIQNGKRSCPMNILIDRNLNELTEFEYSCQSLLTLLYTSYIQSIEERGQVNRRSDAVQNLYQVGLG